ncbi:MAG: hypothetical protein AB7S36_17440 [Planctomycetota bacterium]
MSNGPPIPAGRANAITGGCLIALGAALVACALAAARKRPLGAEWLAAWPLVTAAWWFGLVRWSGRRVDFGSGRDWLTWSARPFAHVSRYWLVAMCGLSAGVMWGMLQCMLSPDTWRPVIVVPPGTKTGPPVGNLWLIKQTGYPGGWTWWVAPPIPVVVVYFSIIACFSVLLARERVWWRYRWTASNWWCAVAVAVSVGAAMGITRWAEVMVAWLPVTGGWGGSDGGHGWQGFYVASPAIFSPLSAGALLIGLLAGLLPPAVLDVSRAWHVWRLRRRHLGTAIAVVPSPESLAGSQVQPAIELADEAEDAWYVDDGDDPVGTQDAEP